MAPRRWQIPQTVVQAAKSAHTDDAVERARLKDLAHGLPVAMTTLTALTSSAEPTIAQWASTIRDKVIAAEQAHIGEVLVSSGFDETGCTPDAFGVLDPDYDGQRIVAVVRGQDADWQRITASGWEQCDQPIGMPYMQLRGDTLADAIEAMTAGASLLLYPSQPCGWLSTKVEQALVSAAQATQAPSGGGSGGVYAIVDPLNTSAILTLFHVETGPQGPVIAVRKGGTWVPDDGTLHAQLQGFNPPPVVTVSSDQVADVLRQADDFDAAHPGVASGPTGGATQSATVPDAAPAPDASAPAPVAASANNWAKWNEEHKHIHEAHVPIAELEPLTMSNHLDSDSPKIKELTEDIRKNGVRKPIQVEKTNKGMLIGDGHHRLLAAKRAGLTHVPVKVYANTPEGRRAANKAMVASSSPDGLKAAGLMVQAADTGRVFMLQRGLDEEDDPAKGKWEAPGGVLENGEHPLSGAIREWEEETGHTLPKGINDPQTQSWTSPNGVYRGYVHVIPQEEDINIADRKVGTNPDDPDGDSFEAAAWWDPAHIAGNDMVRDELKHTMHQVHLALAGSDSALTAAMHHQRRVREAKDTDATFDADRAAGDQAEQEKRRQFETMVSSRFSILTAEGLDENEAASTIRREIDAETARRDLWEKMRSDALLQEKERRLRVQPEIRMSKELHERQLALTADAVPHTRIPDQLFKYWVAGKGAAKIRWNESGDWQRCRDHLIKYVKSDYQTKALCAELHKFATGRWTGSRANKLIEGGK